MIDTHEPKELSPKNVCGLCGEHYAHHPVGTFDEDGTFQEWCAAPVGWDE